MKISMLLIKTILWLPILFIVILTMGVTLLCTKILLMLNDGCYFIFKSFMHDIRNLVKGTFLEETITSINTNQDENEENNED